MQKHQNVKLIKETNFYVGTYTEKDSKGIYTYSISKEGKLEDLGIAATITNPSFLAKSKDNKTLFAVSEINENETGYIYSYEIKNDSLQMVNKQESGGAHPCFIAVNKDNYIITANYTGGNVGLLKATENGEIAPISFVQQHIGKGSTERQTAPHAHSTWFHPTKNEIISCKNYIDFGLQNANTYDLMFGTAVGDFSQHPELVDTADKTFESLVLNLSSFLKEKDEDILAGKSITVWALPIVKLQIFIFLKMENFYIPLTAVLTLSLFLK